MVILEVDILFEELLFMMVDLIYLCFLVVCEDKDYVEGILLVKDLLLFILNKDE